MAQKTKIEWTDATLESDSRVFDREGERTGRMFELLCGAAECAQPAELEIAYYGENRSRGFSIRDLAGRAKLS